jgi:hypothetical protein
MSRIFSLNAAFSFLSKPSANGARKFGPGYAQRLLKRRQGRLGDIWYLDELFLRIVLSDEVLHQAAFVGPVNWT